MKSKVQERKRYLALITVEFSALSRAEAVEQAKKLIDRPDAKVRVQEAAISWLTVPEASD